MILKMILSCILLLLSYTQVSAEAYGPTLNEVVDKYAVLRNFKNLTENLSREKIDIRLGMTYDEVKQWARGSKIYKIDSTKNSTYRFVQKDGSVSFHDLSFDVVFRNGKVVMIKTWNLNDFEFNKEDLVGLKALKKVTVNECWSTRNYIDLNSYENGFDFAFQSELGAFSEECMGSDRGNVTIGKPGLLYPKHLKKNQQKTPQ